MNSFTQSRTEVFEKIEESLRPLCTVEDLNDDEIMELCILSNELHACETTALLNPSKFASCATRLGLRERVQNREQPELLARSPPSDDFSSLLNTCVESQEISKLKTERIEPQIKACVQAYKLQMEMRKHFVHEHPKDSTSWEMPEFRSLVSDPTAHSVDGPMCRWSLKDRGSQVSRKELKFFVEMVDGNVTGDTST